MRKTLPLAILLATVGLAAPRPALAAPPWVYRDIVLPRGEVALDVGLGIGHAPDPGMPAQSVSGPGLNLELTAGLSRGFELGLRTGFRFNDGAQATQADRYGRPFDTETFGTFYDREANPELHLRWAMARGPSAALALELRFYLPIEDDHDFGFMIALPIRLHTSVVRVDTGIYVPVIFTNPTETVVSIPVHVWFQVTPAFWVGPLTGINVVELGGEHTGYPLGFGLGVGLDRAVDFRAWFLFPDLNQDDATRTWGVGVALQIRFD